MAQKKADIAALVITGLFLVAGLLYFFLEGTSGGITVEEAALAGGFC